MNRWAGQPLAISAMAWFDGVLSVRLSGAEVAVQSARRTVGGLEIADGVDFWRAIREQTHSFFAVRTLWRIAVPSITAPLEIAGTQLIEWGGGLRWERTGECDERDEKRQAPHRKSGTRPNDFACGMTAAASVDSHCSSTEL